MTRRTMACLGCWLALTLAAVAQEPAPAENASAPTAEQAARLQELDELVARAQGLQTEGKYPEAIEVAEQVLSIQFEVFGEVHAEIVKTYFWMGGIQELVEDLAAAEKSRQSVLALQIKLHGVDDWRAIDARLRLKHVRKLAALDAADRQEFRRAESLNDRVVQLWRSGKSREALPLAEESLAILRRILGDDSPYTATGLYNLAAQHVALEEYARAELCYRESLEIWRRLLGEAHPDYARSLESLAVLLEEAGAYGQADPLYRQVLDIKKRAFGEAHAEYADGLSNLGMAYFKMGDYARAEPLFRQALGIFGRVGPEASYAAALNNMAEVIVASRSDFARAEQLYRQALDIHARLDGEEQTGFAATLNNLAAVHMRRGEYPQAEEYLLQSLEIQRGKGEDLPSYAVSLNNLAELYTLMGEHARAEPYYRQALAILKDALGEEHPQYVVVLKNLAIWHSTVEDFAQAEAMFRRALEVTRRTLGTEHPGCLSSLNGLARLSCTKRDYASALVWLRDWSAAYEAARLRVAARSLDRAAFGVEHSPYLHLAAVEAGHGDAIEAWRALEADLARGLLDEATSRAGLQLTAEEEQERVDLNAALAGLQPRILRLVTQLDPDEAAEAELARLIEQRSAASARLARLAAAFSQRQVADLKDVQAALPADGAFVTWVDVSPKGSSIQEHWACVVRSPARSTAGQASSGTQGKPTWVRLLGAGPDGAWTEGDTSLPKRLRDALAQAAAPEDIAELSRQLAAQRIEPLLPHLEGVERLYVAAVHAMAGVPVDVLTDRFTISYTPSGTQLVRLRERERPTGAATLLALGDPVFSQPGDDADAPTEPPRLPSGGLLVTQVIPQGNADNSQIAAGDVLLAYAGTELASVEQLGELVAAHETDESVAVTIWREGEDSPMERTLEPGKLGVALSPDPAPEAIASRRESDLLLASVTRGKVWDELPGTRAEIAGLAELFPERVTLLADSDASEQRLASFRDAGEIAQYRYLHLATHGQVNQSSAFESALILAQDDLSTVDDVAAGREFFDGRLTANEILEDWKLNAELVTLSSCESGLGRAGGGEGFLGFAQALLLAGSRSVCLSLWEVDDTATALLMDRFYQNLLGKRDGLDAPLPKAESLAESKHWLRSLTVSQAAELAADLSHGVARGAGHKTTIVDLVPPDSSDPDAHPYEHPYFWAAFVLIGDPE